MTEDTGAMRVKLWRCPECGFTANDADAWSQALTSYCPSCGDEERDPEPVEVLIVPPGEMGIVLSPDDWEDLRQAADSWGVKPADGSESVTERLQAQMDRAALTEEGS